MQEIGRKLRHAREIRDESVTEAARLCYLSPSMVRWIEEDEYGQFPGLSYARSALRRYGKHVRVDVDEAAEELRDHDVAKFAQGDYTWGASGGRSSVIAAVLGRWKRLRSLRDRSMINQSKSARRKIPLLLNAVILLAVALLIALFWIGYRADSSAALLEGFQERAADSGADALAE